MTKKDFELIAKVLANNKPKTKRGLAWRLWKQVVMELANELAGTNSRFDRYRFFYFCGLEG